MMRQLPGWNIPCRKTGTVVDGNDTRLVKQPATEEIYASRNLIIDIDPDFPWQLTTPMVTVPT